MKTITLRPYPGKVILCATKKEYRREHKKLFGDSISLKGKFGRCDGHKNGTFIVWAVDQAMLAHEFGHVIFTLFGLCGINPADSQGEAFCYLLSQMILDAGNDIKTPIIE